jgi:hypothetical protein
MKVRTLIWRISLVILVGVLPLLGSHSRANFSTPLRRADGGEPPPPPLPWVRTPTLVADGGEPPPPPLPPKPPTAALVA